jgi:hypothetical protein
VQQLLRTLQNSSGPGAARGMVFSEFRELFLLLPRSDMLVDYWLRASCPGACDIGGCVTVRDEVPRKVRTRMRNIQK